MEVNNLSQLITRRVTKNLKHLRGKRHKIEFCLSLSVHWFKLMLNSTNSYYLLSESNLQSHAVIHHLSEVFQWHRVGVLFQAIKRKLMNRLSGEKINLTYLQQVYTVAKLSTSFHPIVYPSWKVRCTSKGSRVVPTNGYLKVV